MIRSMSAIAAILLLGEIAMASFVAQPAVAQIACAPGFYYDPLLGCLIAGYVSVQPVYPSADNLYPAPIHTWGALSHPDGVVRGVDVAPIVGRNVGHGHR